jgi:hypothetical protein
MTAQPRELVVIPIEKNQGQYWPRIILSGMARKHGIAKGYFVELLLINFVVADGEVPIFQNELKVVASDTEIQKMLMEEHEALQTVAQSFETIGILSIHGFHEIANELTEGLTRFEKNDNDGAIKFFRLVVEAFRDKAKGKIIDGSDSRGEEIGAFLSKSYSLISNLGEHHGTQGSRLDAQFTRDITIAISRYMAQKLSQEG